MSSNAKKAFLVFATSLSLAACDDAHVVSRNMSTAADNFEITRRIVFYNGINGEYMLTIEGLCALGKGDETKSVTVTCKLAPNKYKKHFLGLSDNVTFFAEQTEPAEASPYHYRVIFKPAVLVPDIQIK